VIPFIGGALINSFGYAGVFWMSGLVGLVGLLGMSTVVKNPKTHKEA
jgi:predicted MFS family arabinose efflux permease